MAVRKASPKGDFMQRADTQATAALGAVDLLAVAGKPQFAPQRLELRATATPGAVVLRPEKGVDYTINLLANERVAVLSATKAIVSSVATGDFVAYWYDAAGQLHWNNE